MSSSQDNRANIEIGLSECDIEMFKDMIQENGQIEWSFLNQNGEEVSVMFMTQDALETKNSK